MKTGWKVVMSVLDAIVWLWGKIKPTIEKDKNQSINQLK